MGLILFIVGVVLFAGTFAKPKNEADAKKLEMFRKHKWKFRIVGYLLISIGVMLMSSDTLQSTNTTQSTSQISNQASSISGTESDLKKALVSFYKQNYPEATISGNHHFLIQFPYKNTSLTVFVGDMSNSAFTVHCFSGLRYNRNLGPKECLAPADQAGRSVIAAFYHIYKIKKPSEEEFIEFLRHKCIERKCDIKNMTVESDNKRYTLHLYSYYILPKIKRVQEVLVTIHNPVQLQK